MAEISNYLENSLLNHVLRGDTGGTSFAQPSTVYLAFHTANPTDTGGGAEFVGGSYARQIMEFGAAASGVSVNTNSASFVSLPTANLTHLGLWDSSSGGNLLFHTPITTIAFNSGDDANVNPGAITVSLD